MRAGWPSYVDAIWHAAGRGRAYGGSELLGGVVLTVLYLFLVQFVLLVGYALTLQIEARRGRPLRDPRRPEIGAA